MEIIQDKVTELCLTFEIIWILKHTKLKNKEINMVHESHMPFFKTTKSILLILIQNQQRAYFKHFNLYHTFYKMKNKQTQK